MSLRPLATRPLHRTTALALLLTACAPVALAARTPPPPPEPKPAAPASAPAAADPYPAAPVSALVQAVSIPYERFTLPNGLTVLVHTDRKAPVVAVSVWYGVGSKNEPRGRTGFAHLFEHLMFYGSTHVEGDFFVPLTQAGATDANGSTWFDRTNYYETVPTGALDRVLMMESDRMGFLLDAVTQARLDAQRAVVQNEKRQGDNRPYGLAEYEALETLYPAGHPYHHSTIGSMGDLDAASLADVKTWFRDHYGPNNAVLVLAGDIDLATAKDKVTRWFGEFPAGPRVQPVSAPVPTLPAPVVRNLKDTVATTRISRVWAVPGLDNPDYLPLRIGATVLGGLASSRLDDALVRKSTVAVAVAAGSWTFAQAGQFFAQADVKPGTDAASAARALDAEIARLVSEGPTADELQRAVTQFAAEEIRGLEAVGGDGGKAPTLAEGLLYSGDPAHYRAELEAAAKLTPQDVRAALQKWLTRPALSLTIEPGTRTAGGEARGGDSALAAAPPAPPAPPTPVLAPPADRSRLPGPGDVPTLAFPAIERARLSNGIEVLFARRAAVPVVSVQLAFDAGSAADPADAPGTQALLLKVMDEGTATLEASELARVRERLGAAITAASSADATTFQLDALTPNLASSLALLADFVRRPGLRPADLERVRAQQLAAIDAELAEPQATAQRALFPALFGADHPYGRAPTGTGSKAVVARLSRADLMAFHDAWLRPDKARIVVAGDTTLAEVTALLEKSFGDWRAPATPAPVKSFAAAIPAPRPRVLLIDRPAAPQSMIVAGEVLGQRGTDDLIPLKAANEVLGNNFLSRINSNLREAKGWSYGSYSVISDRTDRVTFRVIAPVQTDKTGPAIAEIRKELSSFMAGKGITPDELGWSTAGSARELAGTFETSGAVLEAVAKIAAYHRPDDFYTRLPERYKAFTAAQLDAAGRASLNPANLTWVIVGDAAKVKPQLADLGLPVEVVKAAE